MKKVLVYLFCLIIFSCNKDKDSFDRFPDEKSKEEIDIAGLSLSDSHLSLSLFAKEPNVVNPTNIAVDAKGRVWVLEAYNYRNGQNNVPYEPKGDKISILEDLNEDGKMDKKTIFYQGEDVNAALGIVVLGKKIIVSCSPNVLVFEDSNSDDKPDNKSILFKTKGGNQSDHGIHAFSFGPDGKLYFNFGNYVEGLLDLNGNLIKDKYGRNISNENKPFQEGMAIRCDLDGKNMEVLGWNFRNPFEVTVDAFGRIWQSDNDDDGIRANRILNLLPNGNYGYKDETTRADWRADRSNLEDSLFLQHWHQNDPGVVPNLYQTYSGSPTGIVFNEWSNLGSEYKNTILLADAGKNEVNAYTLNENGATYKLDKKNLLKGNDQWFRPSDIAFGPDGSLFVADWYDSGVGGHFIGDLKKGRIYKIKGTSFKPKNDIEALSSPNQDVRYQAFVKLKKEGNLENNISLEENQRARLTFLQPKYDKLNTTNLKIAGINANIPLNNFIKEKSSLIKAVALSKLYKTNDINLFTAFRNGYNGNDKFFLEAIGIAADGFWDTYSPSIFNNVPKNEVYRNLVIRSRSKDIPALLEKLILENKGAKNADLFRAFDYHDKVVIQKILLNLLKKDLPLNAKIDIFKHLEYEQVQNNKDLKSELITLLKTVKGKEEYFDLMQKYALEEESDNLQNFLTSSNSDQQKSAASLLLKIKQFGILKTILNSQEEDSKKAIKIKLIGQAGGENICKNLNQILQNRTLPTVIREAAVLGYQSYSNDVILWRLIKSGKFPSELMPAAHTVLKATFHSDLKIAYEYTYKKPAINKGQNLTFLNEKGDLAKGKELYQNYCSTCHLIGKNGQDFGPNLSHIGSKLSLEAIYSAIQNPNQGISFGYETTVLTLSDGSQVQGILTSKTPTEYLIKYPGSSSQNKIKISTVKKEEKLKSSIMPAFQLTEKENLNLCQYLHSLK